MPRWLATRLSRNSPPIAEQHTGSRRFCREHFIPFPQTSRLRRQTEWLLAFLLVVTTVGAAEGNDDAYLTELIRRASEARLAEQRYWHLLLHYRENLGGGYTSEVDDPGFFMAPTGKTDPQAELEATLAKFFSDELVGRSRQPAQCAFVARYHWLKSELAIDDRRLPPQTCERFQSWFAEMNPQSITLIFASAFLNNPSSMFGHTFLRIDPKGQTEQTRLLAYTINYAAEVTTENEFAFAILGVFGGFKGYFSTIPYYIKVQEYRDFANRDIWEYLLNLSAEQITRMLMHAWELGNAYFDYFFFKENCSYHILSLLEVADPRLRLTDQFVAWTVPADTVRVITQYPDLVADIAYRPSRSTQIRRKRAVLSEAEDQSELRLIDDPAAADSAEFTRLPPDRQTFLLDLATDYLRYRSATAPAGGAAPYRDQQRALLVTRSRIKIPSEDTPIMPFTDRPQLGHSTSRAGLGAGWRQDEFFEELTIRAGYHDLLDPDVGFASGAQIELLSFSLRHYNRRDQSRLERFKLADIVSLTPTDALFKSPSWKISAGYDTVNRHDCRYCGNANLNGGIGVAAETHASRPEVHLRLTDLDANYSHAFEQNHRVGGGGTVGLLADFTERWKVLLSGTYLGYPLGEHSDEVRASVQQRYTLMNDLALRLEFNHRRRDNEAVLSVQVYF